MEARDNFLKTSAILVIISVVFLFFVSSASAAGSGTSAATFLKLGFGARPLALGEAFVAMADDVSALHYNPAGLSLGQPPMRGPRGAYEMLFSHTLHIEDITLDQLGLVRRPFGLSLTSLRIGDIERRTAETAAPEGEFGASDLCLGLSYARKIGEVGVGTTVKFIRQTIGGAAADAYAVDLGVLHRFEGQPISVGAGVANVGTMVRFLDQASPLPITLRAGITAGMRKTFPHALSFEIDFPRDADPVFRFGAEYLGFGPFALRMGYRTFEKGQRDAVLGKALGSAASGLSEFYGLFMGVGLRSRLGDLDYSILPYGELGQAHRVSLSMRFGEPRRADVAGK